MASEFTATITCRSSNLRFGPPANQPLTPVAANSLFPFQPAACNSHAFDDERTHHFKIVRVMGKDSLQVMRIPCIHPFPSESFCPVSINHSHYPMFVSGSHSPRRFA